MLTPTVVIGTLFSFSDDADDDETPQALLALSGGDGWPFVEPPFADEPPTPLMPPAPPNALVSTLGGNACARAGGGGKLNAELLAVAVAAAASVLNDGATICDGDKLKALAGAI